MLQLQLLQLLDLLWRQLKRWLSSNLPGVLRFLHGDNGLLL